MPQRKQVFFCFFPNLSIVIEWGPYHRLLAPYKGALYLTPTGCHPIPIPSIQPPKQKHHGASSTSQQLFQITWSMQLMHQLDKSYPGLYPRPQTSWFWWWWWALGQVKIKQTKVYLNWPISLSNGEIYFAFTFPLQRSAVGRCISLLLLVTRPLGPSKSRRRHRETSEGHKMEGMGQLYTS